jgi:hypothetical protein
MRTRNFRAPADQEKKQTTFICLIRVFLIYINHISNGRRENIPISIPYIVLFVIGLGYVLYMLHSRHSVIPNRIEGQLVKVQLCDQMCFCVFLISQCAIWWLYWFRHVIIDVRYVFTKSWFRVSVLHWWSCLAEHWPLTLNTRNDVYSHVTNSIVCINIATVNPEDALHASPLCTRQSLQHAN